MCGSKWHTGFCYPLGLIQISLGLGECVAVVAWWHIGCCYDVGWVPSTPNYVGASPINKVAVFCC